MDHVALAGAMERIITDSTNGSATDKLPPTTLNQWTWRDVAEAYIDSLAALTPAKRNLATILSLLAPWGSIICSAAPDSSL